MTSKFFLVPCPDGETKESAIRLNFGELVIGRTEECHIYVPDQTVSRSHAILMVNPRQITVKDLKSRNGTWINGSRVTQSIVEPGNELWFGSAKYLITENPKDAAGIDEDLPTIGPNAMATATLDTNLTPRQSEVFQLLIRGKTEKDIAQELSIAKDTVHNHIRKIYEAFGVRSKVELLVKLGPTQDAKSSTKFA